MTEYAVYKKKGITDNDQMDWFIDKKTAFLEAEVQAKELKEGECICLSKIENETFEDFPLEFRKEDGIVKQYKNDTYLWL